MASATLVAIVSAAASIISAGAAVVALDRARVAREVSERMFRRQGVIDLHMAWQGVNSLDPEQAIAGDLVKAVGALELTAALWNHDIIEKLILYQSYWDSYRELVDTLSHSQVVVPEMKRRFCDFITPPVLRAYDEMREFASRQVGSSKLS